MTDQNSATAAMTPMTWDTRLGRKRFTLVTTKRSVIRKNPASTNRSATTANAITTNSSGYAVSTGSSFLSSRIEFCHGTADQRTMIATIVKRDAETNWA